MELNMLQKTEILIMTLQGFNDKEIAKYMRIRGMLECTLRYQRTKGLLPKRKQVLSFIAGHFLSRLASEALANGLDTLSGDFLVHALNTREVKSTTLKTWSSDSVKRFLQTKGVRCYQNTFSAEEISSMGVPDLTEVAIYDKSIINPEDYIPPADNLSWSTQQIVQPFVNGLNKRKEEIKLAIEQSLKEGAETIANVTDYLNSNGFTNKSGNPLGRWSVKLLMQEFGLEVHEKLDAMGYSAIMEDWVRTHPKEERIEREGFVEKLNSYLKGEEVFKNVSNLFSSLSPIIAEHNKNVRDQERYLKYKEQVEFAVYVKYKHKPITAEEMGAELGMSAMTGNRVMRQVLGIEPFDVWFKNLYDLVSNFVKANPKFYIQDLAEYLQSSYIRTQRDSDWDYPTTNLTYQRLQERYPDLPNSLGRRL